MSTIQLASPASFCPPQEELASFRLGGIVDYLKEVPSSFDLHQNNGICCDPRNVSKDVHQNALPTGTGDSDATTHAINAAQELEVVDPASIGQDWSPEPDNLFCTERSDLLPQNFSQVPEINRRDSGSSQATQDMHWASPMDGLSMDDLDFLRPVDSTSPLSGQDISAPKSDSDGRSVDRVSSQRGSEAGETSKLAWRRAKNRTAASKCRAKQKDRTEALQKLYEESSAQNAYLKRQERVLKGLVISLRDCALQHDSARCRCKVLHAFNMRRAEQISRSMNC